MVSRYVPFTIAPPQQGIPVSAAGNSHSNIQPSTVQLTMMQVQQPPPQHPAGLQHSHPHSQPPPQMQTQQQQQQSQMQLQSQAVSLGGGNHMHIPPPSVTPQLHLQHQHQHQQAQQLQHQHSKKLSSNNYQILMPGVVQAPQKFSSHNTQVQKKNVPPIASANMPAAVSSSICYRAVNQHNRDAIKANGVFFDKNAINVNNIISRKICCTI